LQIEERGHEILASKTCVSPVNQIVSRKRNRNKYWKIFKWARDI